MPYYAHDFLDVIEHELQREREELSRKVDRIDAIVAVRSIAIDLSSRLQRPIDARDVFASGKTEEERARLAALERRILGEEQGGGQPARGGGRDGD